MTEEALLSGECVGIARTDESAEAAARLRLDQLTKPPGSLGRLEDIAARLARVQGTDHPSVSRKAIVLMAGDHGVVAEGVSPYPQDVTWQMVANFAAGGAAINQLAASVGADIRLVDMGVAKDISGFAGVIDRNVQRGTANMALGPAMSREIAARAVREGMRVAREAIAEGYAIVGTGEMGIGNTTSAAALTCALTGADPEAVVGPGTGLDADGVARKMEVVERALRANAVETLDVLGVLAAVGGLEIAGLAGVVIGCASEGVCVVADGFISGAAALVAVRMCPAAADYLFASHRSAEPGHRVVLEALGLQPVLELDMRLGEGTGAALAIGIMDAACRMLSGMATFAEAGVAEETGVSDSDLAEEGPTPA
ncbi:MAG: nicotinate-nucleotide--dimethylbenzimidazole phosphoribosyltransferase [Actinomycetota bacterium]|nr:nicotinate-nucleotide--dimethylbenzimidazole phosphoribosyltransferase [Actinomycetota bacterium]